MKFTFSESSYNYMNIDHAIKDNVFRIQFRENLRVVVPENITELEIPGYFNVTFTECNVENTIRNNEYRCFITIPLDKISINLLNVESIEIDCTNLNDIPKLYMDYLKDPSIPVYTYKSSINEFNANNGEHIVTPTYIKPENSFEVELEGVSSYDCNELPSNFEDFDVIYLSSLYDFEVLNIPDGWKIELFNRNISVKLSDTLNSKNRVYFLTGLRTAENRTLKKLVRI